MWKTPPIIKIYEALGSVVDGRLEVSENTAKCFSSSGNKYYDIEYSPDNNAIMVNDNGSYWKGYLGYPAIAFLLEIGVLTYNKDYAQAFQGIAWKDINQKFKNDFDKTVEYIFREIDVERRKEIEDYAKNLINDIENLKLSKLGQMKKPPSDY